MDKSPSASVGPNEDQAATEKPRRERWLRLPTSVVITLLVTLLSVWVAPAFTRQWDDRQKARELQAMLAEDIALATATTANRMAVASTRPELLRVKEDWAIAHTRVGAKLRVYYSRDLRRQWDDLAISVREAIYASTLICCQSNPEGTLSWPGRADRLHEVARHLGNIEDVQRSLAPSLEPHWLNEWRRSVMLRARERQPTPGSPILARLIQEISDSVIHRLMTTDPDGFSTTRRDLLRDLLP